MDEGLVAVPGHQAHCTLSLHLVNGKLKLCLLLHFLKILKRIEIASAELTFDRVMGEREKISGEATLRDSGLPSKGCLGLLYCQTRCLFRLHFSECEHLDISSPGKNLAAGVVVCTCFI